MKLFDLAPAYEQALAILAQMEDDGCTQDELDEALRIVQEIEGSFQDKCRNIAAYIKNLQADADAIKSAQDAMDKRRKSITAKVDRMRAFLLSGMKLAGVDRVEFPEFVVSHKLNPEAVKIADGAQIPAEYLRMPEPEPNKTAIKEALKHGKIIPGCTLERGEKLEIK